MAAEPKVHNSYFITRTENRRFLLRVLFAEEIIIFRGFFRFALSPEDKSKESEENNNF